MPPNPPSIDSEFAAFSRYLVGRAAPGAFRDRYAAGCRVLFGDEPESAALRLARRSPWTIPCLDAACALTRRDDPLRKRLLLLTAILEASPEFADEFLPRRLCWGTLLFAMPWWGACSAAKAVTGVVLLKLASGDPAS